MKFEDYEVRNMTNAQLKALIEAIKIIYDLNPGQLKSALDQIQSTLEQPK